TKAPGRGASARCVRRPLRSGNGNRVCREAAGRTEVFVDGSVAEANPARHRNRPSPVLKVASCCGRKGSLEADPRSAPERRGLKFGHFRIAGGIGLPFFVGNFVGMKAAPEV